MHGTTPPLNAQLIRERREALSAELSAVRRRLLVVRADSSANYAAYLAEGRHTDPTVRATLKAEEARLVLSKCDLEQQINRLDGVYRKARANHLLTALCALLTESGQQALIERARSVVVAADEDIAREALDLLAEAN